MTWLYTRAPSSGHTARNSSFCSEKSCAPVSTPSASTVLRRQQGPSQLKPLQPHQSYHTSSSLSNQSSQARKSGRRGSGSGGVAFQKRNALLCGLPVELVIGRCNLPHSFPAPTPRPTETSTSRSVTCLCRVAVRPHSPGAKALGLQPGTDHRGLRARAELGLRGSGPRGYPAGTRTALRQARLQLLVDTKHLGEFLCRRETVKGESAGARDSGASSLPRVEPEKRRQRSLPRVTFHYSPFSLGSKLFRLSQLSHWGRT